MSRYTKKQMPAVDALFLQLQKSEMPNFLELLSALSDVGDASVLDELDEQGCDTAILRSTATPQYPVLQPGASCLNCG